MNLDELGAWDGDVFQFHEPIRVGEAVMENIDFTDYEEGDGITREDVLHALLNPVKVTWVEDKAPTWQCERCTRTRWVGWRNGPEHEGWPRYAQCVRCGHVQDLPDES